MKTKSCKADLTRTKHLMVFDFLKSGQKHHDILVRHQCQNVFTGRMNNFGLRRYGKLQLSYLVFARDEKIDIEVYEINNITCLTQLDFCLCSDGYHREFFKQLKSWYYNLNLI